MPIISIPGSPGGGGGGGGITLTDVWNAGGVRWNDTDLIDENSVVVSDLLTAATYQSLPAASTKSGRIYIVTTPTPAAYYSNGTTWYQIGDNEPMYTWATIPAANSMPSGTTVRVDPSSFGGTYKSPLGILMVTDGTVWRPKGGAQLMARGASSLASPIATVTGTGSDVLFPITTQFSLPAGLLSYTGIGIRVRAVFQKTGADAAASTFRIKLGKNNSSGTSDIVASIATNAVALDGAKLNQTARVTTLGANTVAVFTTDTLQDNGRGTSLIVDRNTYLDTTTANYVLFTASGVSGATHALISFTIELVG